MKSLSAAMLHAAPRGIRIPISLRQDNLHPALVSQTSTSISLTSKSHSRTRLKVKLGDVVNAHRGVCRQLADDAARGHVRIR